MKNFIYSLCASSLLLFIVGKSVAQVGTSAYDQHCERQKARQLKQSQSIGNSLVTQEMINKAKAVNAQTPVNKYAKEVTKSLNRLREKAYPECFYHESFTYTQYQPDPGWFQGEDSLRKCTRKDYEYIYRSLTDKGIKIYDPRLLPADDFDVRILMMPYTDARQNGIGIDLGEHRFLYSSVKGISVSSSSDDLKKELVWIPLKTFLPPEICMIIRYKGENVTFILGKDAVEGESEGEVVWTGKRAAIAPPNQFAYIAQGKQAARLRNVDVRSKAIFTQ